MDGVSEHKISKTYQQDWKAYNAAQTCEKEQFLELLYALCSGIDDPHKQTNGRPFLPISDVVFSICYKIFSTVSGRRFMSDLRDAQEKGYIRKAPHFNSIFNYLQNPDLTPILQDMIILTSLPLASVETDFAADSSGFTVSRYSRWHDHKYGQKKQHDWVKVHLMCGVKTHIVTAVEIRDKNASDTKLLPDLVVATAQNFTMTEVSADKAYGSINNYAVIQRHGAIPYIDFKSNHSGLGKGMGRSEMSHRPAGGDLWAKMYHYFQFNKEEYMDHYHKRSNVETVFSMIKAKFGGSVKSKTDTAMANECRVKIICHNICVLIQETHELGIDVSFKSLIH